MNEAAKSRMLASPYIFVIFFKTTSVGEPNRRHFPALRPAKIYTSSLDIAI
jgi:hypothetical protein